MPSETHITTSAPTVAANQLKRGDLWLDPSTRVLKICTQTDPVVLFTQVGPGAPVAVLDVPAGGTGAAAGAWDTSGNRDSAISRINALMAALRAQGIIS